MKRTSILATSLIAGLLSTAALSASSASAVVLCDSLHAVDCPAENTYGVGTKFHATKNGAMTLKSGSGATLFACADSALDMTVTKAGGPAINDYPEVDVTNLTFGLCGDDPTSVVSDGTALISPYNYSGSLKGLFNWSGEQIETNTTNSLYPKPFKCAYNIVGTGTLEGPKTVEYMEYTRLVFSSATAEKVGGSIFCPGIAYFSGQYNFDLEYPEGIYVVQK